MKAAVLHQYDEKIANPSLVQFEEVPNPKIEKTSDVIVKIGGAGVCRTDLHIVEGLWRPKVQVTLPYIMGHENAGWVEEVGKGVEGFKKGDAVICHPLITHDHDLSARRGEDMHSEGSIFPGINANGGYAELLKTSQRALVKLPQTLAPIGIQVLAAMSAAKIIVVDRSDAALKLAKEVGADFTVKADGNEVERVKEITKGYGAEAVIDFVGEGGSIEKGLAMTRNAGYYYVVGYGGDIKISAMDMITTERTIVGNLVGNYAE